MTTRPAPAQPNANAYFRTKVLTASPAELRLMLFDGALRFAETARSALLEKNYERVYDGVTRCQAIILELINNLRPEHDPELCNNLSSLYTFMYTRLMTASHERDPAIIDEVIDLLKYERETWVMLMESMAKENHAASNMSDTPAATGSPAGVRSAAEALVGRRVSIDG